MTVRALLRSALWWMPGRLAPAPAAPASIPPPSTAPAACAARSGPGGRAEEPPTHASRQEAGCLLLAHAVHTAAGSSGPVCGAATASTSTSTSGADLAAALRHGRLRPLPDRLLRDAEDLAPFSTRVAALDERLDAHPVPPAGAAAHPPRLLRCLALLDPCLPMLEQAGTRLAGLLAGLAPPHPPGGGLVVPTELARLAPAPTSTGDWAPAPIADAAAALWPGAPAFEVWLALPPELPQAAADAALAWLAPQVGALPAFEPRAHRLVQPPAGSGVAVLAAAQRQVLAWQQQGRCGLLLLLVADTLIDEQALLHPARAAQVVNGRRTKGLSLGEAAVALLLGTRGLPAQDAGGCFLPRLAWVQRAHSADAEGRTCAQAAHVALGQALQAAHPDHSDRGDHNDGTAGEAPWLPARLASDADLRPGRSTELYGAVLAHAVHLDAGEDLDVLGVALGDCGIAGAPLALACAATSCVRTRRPAAWLSVLDPHARGAGLVLPADPWHAGARRGAAPDRPSPAAWP